MTPSTPDFPAQRPLLPSDLGVRQLNLSHGYDSATAILDKASRKNVIVQTHRAQAHLLAPPGSQARHRWDPKNKRYSWNKDGLSHAWSWAQRLSQRCAPDALHDVAHRSPCWLLAGLTSGLVLGAGSAHADRVLTRVIACQTDAMSEAQCSQLLAAAIVLDSHNKEWPTDIVEQLQPLTALTNKLLGTTPTHENNLIVACFRQKLMELLLCQPADVLCLQKKNIISHTKKGSEKKLSSSFLRSSTQELLRQPSMQGIRTPRAMDDDSSTQSRPASRQSTQTVYSSNSSSPRTSNLKWLYPDEAKEPWTKINVAGPNDCREPSDEQEWELVEPDA